MRTAVLRTSSTVVERARPAITKDRLLWGQNLRLNEKVAEGGVQGIRRRRRENDLRIAGDIERLSYPIGIRDADAA